MTDRPSFLSDVQAFPAIRQLPDGRWLAVHRLLFHWTLLIDNHEFGYEDRYCYQYYDDAVEAMNNWDGEGDAPGNWHRHPTSGRRRDATGREWIDGDATGREWIDD